MAWMPLTDEQIEGMPNLLGFEGRSWPVRAFEGGGFWDNRKSEFEEYLRLQQIPMETRYGFFCVSELHAAGVRQAVKQLLQKPAMKGWEKTLEIALAPLDLI